MGNIDFSNLFITLGKGRFKTIAEAKAASVATLNYGLFINNVIDFLIVFFSIFMVIRFMSREAKRKQEVVAITTKSVHTA